MCRLNRHKPKMTLDHLVRERYPSFPDALRDMDDPLCMIHLFASLPAKITRSHSPEMGELAARLCAEFQTYVYQTKTLKKTFVSIKGIYYQANIMGQNITWLVPHKFTPIIPSDVDFRVMLTFLEFYLTVVKFVNYKLFHDLGFHYPPRVDELALARRAGLSMIQTKSIEEAASETATTKAAVATQEKDKLRLSETLQEQIAGVLDTLEEEKPEKQEEAKDDDDEDDPDLEKMQDAQDAPIFKGLTFLLGREVPVDSLEFVLLCGGAVVLREDQMTDTQVRDKSITHQVVDRPRLQHNILSREYIQPQWVYDSINSQALLPCEPYAPGIAPPPHLSPFVDDKAEGYVPDQRKVLEEWGAKGSSTSEPGEKMDDKEDKAEQEEEEGEGDEEQDENKFAKELKLERKGVAFSDALEDEDEDEGDEGDGEDGEGDADAEAEEEAEEEEEGEGEDEGEEEEEEEEKVKPKAVSKAKGKPEKQDPKALAKIMMPRKDARLYSKMQHGITKKREAANELERKKQKIQKQSNPAPKGKAQSKKRAKQSA